MESFLSRFFVSKGANLSNETPSNPKKKESTSTKSTTKGTDEKKNVLFNKTYKDAQYIQTERNIRLNNYLSSDTKDKKHLLNNNVTRSVKDKVTRTLKEKDKIYNIRGVPKSSKKDILLNELVLDLEEISKLESDKLDTPISGSLQLNKVKSKKQKSKKLEPVKEEPVKKESVKKESVKKEPVKKEHIKEEPVKKEPVKKEPIKEEPIKEEPIEQESVKEDSVKEEPVKEEPVEQELGKEEPVKEEPVEQEPVEQEPVEQEPESESESESESNKVKSNQSGRVNSSDSRSYKVHSSNTVSSKVHSDSDSASESESDSDSNSDSESEELSDKVKSESDKVKSESDKVKSESDKVKSESDKVKSESDKAKSESDHDSHLILKGFKFNSKQILKNDIFILNSNLTDNIETLMKILSNITKNNYIDDIESVYNNNVKFMINPDDKKDYKKMLLEYPYSYFNKFSFTKSLNEKDNSDYLKQIYVIDYDHLKTDENMYKTVNKLFLSKSKFNHFIFISSNTVNSSDFLMMSENIITVHNIETLKALQKSFYKHIIKVIVKSHTINDLDEYKRMININDINTIIINNGILKYN